MKRKSTEPVNNIIKKDEPAESLDLKNAVKEDFRFLSFRTKQTLWKLRIINLIYSLMSKVLKIVVGIHNEKIDASIFHKKKINNQQYHFYFNYNFQKTRAYFEF